jgi:hypothetical protein
MSKDERHELMVAYEAVFDERDQIRACGRSACEHLIQIMRKHTSEDVGDESTGRIRIEKMQEEYYKLIIS